MSEVEMIFCATGIYASYLTYGILQEGIYKYQSEEGAKFTFTFSLLVVQCIVNLLGSLVGSMLTGVKATPGVPATSLIPPATTFIGAMFCSNQALKYVSYPTQALGKSVKMVPVMMFQVLWFGKKYTLREYAMVVLVTVGIALFQMKSSGGNDSFYGLLLLFGSLACDGLTGPVQESVDKKYNATPYQIMFWCNFWAIFYLLVGVYMYEGTDGFVFALENQKLLWNILTFCVVSAVGQTFIFLTLTKFNALILTTVTTTRKFFTILGSVFYYGHQLKPTQWAGIALVSTGLGLELYNKYSKKKVKEAEKTTKAE